MEKGHNAAVTAIVEDEAGIKVPIFSKPAGHVHVRQIGCFDHICSGEVKLE